MDYFIHSFIHSHIHIQINSTSWVRQIEQPLLREQCACVCVQVWEEECWRGGGREGSRGEKEIYSPRNTHQGKAHVSGYRWLYWERVLHGFTESHLCCKFCWVIAYTMHGVFISRVECCFSKRKPCLHFLEKLACFLSSFLSFCFFFSLSLPLPSPLPFISFL